MRRGGNLMLGERLTQLRKARKLTQQQIADNLHLSRGTYAQYEINRRIPEYSTLEKMANFFEVSIDNLVGRSIDQNNSHSENANNMLDALDLSDEDLVKNFKLTVDGVKLTDDQIKQFIAYVRIARAMDK